MQLRLQPYGAEAATVRMVRARRLLRSAAWRATQGQRCQPQEARVWRAAARPRRRAQDGAARNAVHMLAAPLGVARHDGGVGLKPHPAAQ